MNQEIIKDISTKLDEITTTTYGMIEKIKESMSARCVKCADEVKGDTDGICQNCV